MVWFGLVFVFILIKAPLHLTLTVGYFFLFSTIVFKLLKLSTIVFYLGLIHFHFYFACESCIFHLWLTYRYSLIVFLNSVSFFLSLHFAIHLMANAIEFDTNPWITIENENKTKLMFRNRDREINRLFYYLDMLCKDKKTTQKNTKCRWLMKQLRHKLYFYFFLFSIHELYAISNAKAFNISSHSEIEYYVASTTHCQWGYNYKFISTGRETAPNNEISQLITRASIYTYRSGQSLLPVSIIRIKQ